MGVYKERRDNLVTTRRDKQKKKNGGARCETEKPIKGGVDGG